MWGAHHDLVCDEVAPNLATTETDLHPMLLVGLWFFKSRGDLWVKWVNLKTWLHALCAFLRKNPRICTARIKKRSDLLWLARAYVQFTNVAQVL